MADIQYYIETEMYPINERLNQLIEVLGINKNQLAIKAGLQPQTIGKYITGRLKKDNSGEREYSQPGTEIINKILHAIPNLRPEWLLNGVGEMFKNDLDSLVEKNILSPIEDLDHISIPMLDARVIASFASNIYGTMSNIVTENHYLAVKQPGKDYEGIFALKVLGDSMKPIYIEGTIVLVRLVPQGKWHNARDVHAISLKDGMFTLKDIVKNNNNVLTLKATNPNNDFKLEVQYADILCMFEADEIVHRPKEKRK